jgi:hypothetical protein
MGQQSRIKAARRFTFRGEWWDPHPVLTEKQFRRMCRLAVKWGEFTLPEAVEFYAPYRPVVLPAPVVNGERIPWNRAIRRAVEAQERKAGGR